MLQKVAGVKGGGNVHACEVPGPWQACQCLFIYLLPDYCFDHVRISVSKLKCNIVTRTFCNVCLPVFFLTEG